MFLTCPECGLVFQPYEGDGLEEHISCWDENNSHDVIKGKWFYDIGSGYPFIPRPPSSSTSAPPYVRFPGTGPMVHGEQLIMDLENSKLTTWEEIHEEILRYMKQNSVTKVIRLFFTTPKAKKSLNKWRKSWRMGYQAPPYILYSLAKVLDIEIVVLVDVGKDSKHWTTKDPDAGYKTWGKIFV